MTSNQGVYTIVCLANGKRYIGHSTDLKRRFVMHQHRLYKGNHACPALQADWTEHGPDAFLFAVLARVDGDRKALAAAEQQAIDEGQNLYNVRKASAEQYALARPPQRDRRVSVVEVTDARTGAVLASGAAEAVALQLGLNARTLRRVRVSGRPYRGMTFRTVAPRRATPTTEAPTP